MPERRKPERLARLVPAAEYFQMSVKTLRRQIIDGTLTEWRSPYESLGGHRKAQADARSYADLVTLDREAIEPL